ncbi:hypothetical protein PM082_012553 [Marasmius tenuissimus]|nr:hypothetical protein PM082_012553 [Marasmius tenuissimus]
MQLLINELRLRDPAETQTPEDVEDQRGAYSSDDRKEQTQGRNSSVHSPGPQTPTQNSNLPSQHAEESDEELGSDGDSMVISVRPNDTSDQCALDARLEFMTQRIARLEAEQWAPPPGYSRE